MELPQREFACEPDAREALRRVLRRGRIALLVYSLIPRRARGALRGQEKPLSNLKVPEHALRLLRFSEQVYLHWMPP